MPMEENDEENQGVANWQNEDEDEGEDVNSNRPIWDSNDSVLRCRDCSWEVLDGMCQHPGCLKEHDIPDVFYIFVMLFSGSLTDTHVRTSLTLKKRRPHFLTVSLVPLVRLS